MGTIYRELRDAARSLAANPAFTVTVVAILALGIGANSTMFSVLNAVVLRPIPWENPERLVNLLEVNARQGDSGINNNPSTANYKDWREQNQVFERMAAFRYVFFNVADSRAEPERVPGMRVSAEFFPLIGVKPALGRNFLPEEEQPGADHVVLLSNGCWRRRYGADPAIVGRNIIVEGEPYAVIGVLPDFPMFRVGNRTLDIYTPLALPSAALSREDHSITVYARLRPGTTMARAQSEMDTIARRLEAAYPKTNADWTVKVAPLVEYFAQRRRAMLECLLSAAGFVLLIACANIASLTLARSVSRRKDLAIRMALGAGRLRIVRWLLAESLILALAGGAGSAAGGGRRGVSEPVHRHAVVPNDQLPRGSRGARVHGGDFAGRQRAVRSGSRNPVVEIRCEHSAGGRGRQRDHRKAGRGQSADRDRSGPGHHVAHRRGGGRQEHAALAAHGPRDRSAQPADRAALDAGVAIRNRCGGAAFRGCGIGAAARAARRGGRFHGELSAPRHCGHGSRCRNRRAAGAGSG
jgi:hypothetical protein